MYLHICKDTILKEESIIGMFNIATIKDTEEYAKLKQKLEEQKQWVDASNQEEKTFILTKEKGYLSNISVNTLEKRAKLNIIEK